MSDFAYREMVGNIARLSYDERLELMEEIAESLKSFVAKGVATSERKRNFIDSAWENVRNCQNSARRAGISEMPLEEINAEIAAYRSGN